MVLMRHESEQSMNKNKKFSRLDLLLQPANYHLKQIILDVFYRLTMLAYCKKH